MTKNQNGEYAKIELPRRETSGNSQDLGFHNVGRDRFRLAFRTLNQAVLEQTLD
jgi:hypothetical protein